MEPNDDSGVSVQTVKPDEADSSVMASSSPVVFQCSQCNTIVGDSTVWVTSNKVMRTITLGRVTSKVGVKSCIQVSENGLDKGSTFSTIFCISCKEILGKQYMASPPDLDYIRGRFTFNVEKLNSYLIGSADSAGNFDLADMLNVPSPDYLMARMNKMQFLIVSMNDRIKNLEATLNTGESVPKLSENFNPQSIQAETESVSSTDHISTRQRSDSFHSTETDSEILHGEDDFLNREEALLPWQTGNEHCGRVIEQQMRRNSVVSDQRSINRNSVSRSGIFQQFNNRMGQSDLVTVSNGNSVFGHNKNSEEIDSLYRGNDRRVSSNGRKEQLINERSTAGHERQGKQARGQNTDSQRSNWSDTFQPKKSGSRNDLASPSKNSDRSVSRKQAVMETWPSSGMEKSGRESKKRKM